MSETDAVLNNILIGNRTGDEYYNRIFVVSAYGGMTDLLLENKKTNEPGVYALYAGSENDWTWNEALSAVNETMRGLNRRILEDTADIEIADRFVEDRIEGIRSCLLDLQRLCSFGHFQLEEHLLSVREMLSGVGEAHSAHNTMLLLRRKGVNAVFVDLSGWRETNTKPLDDRITDAFSSIDLTRELPIVTGYAQCREGLVGLYGRGYSEVTFSRIACLTNAEEAIIHKEFHLSSADPKIVGTDQVRTIGQTNYDVADQLSNMGMEAIHPRAAKGMRQMGIPLRIMNTFEPDHKGTIISEDWQSDEAKAEIVTGIPTAYEIEVFDQDMVGIPETAEKVTRAFSRFKVWTVARNTNANTLTHYVTAPLKQVRRIVAALQEDLPSAGIRTRKVCLVSVIGSNLGTPHMFAKAVSALSDAGLDLLAAQQPSRKVDMQFILPEAAFNGAISTLHEALVESPPQKATSRKKAA
ncbi:aspartate kinase [Sneathiella chinensis]|uniref:aspartate kinase n=2 Tax=Sneathiella chinensis TaxID=349750 RepID=A0ABQ5U3Z6_9PROT|nr:aspartate kinase [Sneathiella chinensis]